jgi:hypothetical protein
MELIGVLLILFAISYVQSPAPFEKVFCVCQRKHVHSARFFKLDFVKLKAYLHMIDNLKENNLIHFHTFTEEYAKLNPKFNFKRKEKEFEDFFKKYCHEVDQ